MVVVVVGRGNRQIDERQVGNQPKKIGNRCIR